MYQQGKFAEARTAFSQAQFYAPVNTGVALNLLQCILKLAEKQSKPGRELVIECKRLTRLIDEMPLQPPFEQKFSALQPEIEALLDADAIRR